jgi:hypothetical protein
MFREDTGLHSDAFVIGIRDIEFDGNTAASEGPLTRKTQQVLQLTYDLFYGNGGIWPSLGELQHALNRQSSKHVDASHIARRIPSKLMHPIHGSNGYYASNIKLILTADGIKCCTGSHEDIANLVTAAKWLGRRAERAGLPSDPGECGICFTAHQLAAAVSLSPESDEAAIGRLVAILQAEGWVDDGDGKP